MVERPKARKYYGIKDTPYSFSIIVAKLYLYYIENLILPKQDKRKTLRFNKLSSIFNHKQEEFTFGILQNFLIYKTFGLKL